MKRVYFLLMVLAAMIVFTTRAQIPTDGDYRSAASGNWTSAATWQTRASGTWVAASFLPFLPGVNVYIQAGHTVTVDAALVGCSNLHINNAASTVLAIGPNTFNLDGKLRAYSGTAVTTLGADGTFYSGQTSTTAVGGSCITSIGTGKMSFVGNTRIVTYAGEWGSDPIGWDAEFAANAGQTLTIQTDFKARNITVASGTLISSATSMSPDGGSAGSGILTIKNGATLNFSNSSVAIQRTVPASASSHFQMLYNEINGTLEFSGTGNPVIGASTWSNIGLVIYSAPGNQNFAVKGSNSGGADPNNYKDLTISGGGNKTLPLAITVGGALNFIAGYIISTATNSITFGGNSVTGASNASFVDGPFIKTTNYPATFTFPVGKQNCGPSGTVKGYAPLTISNYSGGGGPFDKFTSEYIRGNALSQGSLTALGVNHISGCDYWVLRRDPGTSTTVDVTLSWTDSINNCITTAPYVNNRPSLTVVSNLNLVLGFPWSNSGVAGVTSGTDASGTVTWGGGSPQPFDYGLFAIGSVNFMNPLPIIINYFTGVKQNAVHSLNWKVTCNSTPSATLILERSTDGRNYSEVYTINATALRCQQPFNYTDAAPAKGVNYYRLKMIDATGKISYSSIVSLLNASAGFDILNIAPNPIVGGNFKLNISAAKNMLMDVVITDMQGRIMQKQTVNMIAGFNTISMNVTNLSAGNYQVYGNTSDGRSSVLRFVIQ